MADNLFNIVIPARYESTRLQGKVLLDLAGKPMLQHVWERATGSGTDCVVIATDSKQVASVAEAFGAQVCMTAKDCSTGTDRVAEVCATLGWEPETVVVNVQGDAPLLPSESIRNVAELLLEKPDASIATACVPIKSREEYLDPNIVKVVADKNGRALYFSRAPVPHGGHGEGDDGAWQKSLRHLGIYAYRVGALQQLKATTPCELEKSERLEQLRALWLGMQIQVAIDEKAHGPDVDTQADLDKVASIIAADAG
ncbi:MAG: 3-deoxy-manno-octulosonate cytidylyltransferase [Gammaproteobacteria bacterium]|nr:3-deoxy-manno-octulosonate cytidylyltransferase [Gammaproteobacteria bacterium]MDP6615866.1 3-deoxy-manno-octulosonate cytidylyltransferase [Gammaproteobacteria bacterium]MDP6694316.1 3-deoxy-manno-octulosonate cytidylyltransferase [Gammaproteobacteria bacterium]